MQPTTMLPKLSDNPQTISFSEGDGVCSAEVFSSYVTVTTNAGNHDHGSSKVKLKNLVDYNWESKFYPGRLLALHISGKYLAYSIKAVNTVNPGTCSGMVRVVYNPEPGNDRRALIKGMKGEIQDLSFAHIKNQVVLACIDDQGNFYVHEIEATESALKCTLIAEVREDTGAAGAWHRVVWCPYIPDEDDAPDEDVARLLLTTHRNIGRMWNMRVIASSLSRSGGVGSARALLEGAGALAAADHSAALVDAAFSPDGTALATAAADGYVMFFQVYMNNESTPRCLHKWQPHGGKPLSCLFFLDNHKSYNCEVQFWKFAVTGAENNTTIKVWSCKSWNCVQTITFTPSIGAEASLGLKAMLDTSASYLLLSDYNTRSLYVLNMARDPDDTTAHCRSISEFLLPFPVLSLCIIDADEQQAKCESRCDDPFHLNGSGGDVAVSPDDFELHHDEEGSGGSCGSEGARRVCVRVYLVQPKGLQEGRLLYAPPRARHDLLHGLSDLALEDKSSEAAPSAITSSILQQQSQQLKNLLMRTQTQPGSLIGQRPESPSMAPQLNLMTPDAFSSGGKRDEDDPPLSATPDVGKRSTADSGSVCDGTPVCMNVSGGPGAAGSGVGGPGPKLTSGGSSPSREVQQILARDDPDAFYDQLEEEAAASPAALAGAALAGAEPLLGELYAPTDTPPLPPLPHNLVCSNSDTSWPQISIAQITEANQRKASSDKSSSQSLNTSLNASLNVAERACSDELRAAPGAARVDRLDSLEQKLDKLTELVTAQSRELRSLRSAIVSPRELVDEALHQHTQRTTQAIESALALGWERVSLAGAAAGAAAGEAAGARAAQAAGAGAARALEPLAAALQHELAAKLSATDHLLRDNIDKMLNSKSVMERLSTAVAKSLSEMVRESFRAALFESVLPVMEKAHAQIFKQINQAFQNGTKEFAANTEAAARFAAERGGSAAAEALRGALQRHAEALNSARAHPAHLAHLTNALKEAAHGVLEKELIWWREQARSVVAQMSRAHSPASQHHPDKQEVGCVQMQVAQIQSLVAAGEVNGAFQQALSASDLALVMCACRAADPGLVFGPPCKLKQHVLLSLVQQLAADITTDTQLKHRYLEEAVMNLDTSSPVTREHLPAIVRNLQKQIMAFLQAAPSHALARQFRMLLMATEALVKGVA